MPKVLRIIISVSCEVFCHFGLDIWIKWLILIHKHLNNRIYSSTLDTF